MDISKSAEDLVAKISSPISGITLAFGPWLPDILEKCVAAICVSIVTFIGHKLIQFLWNKIKCQSRISK